MCYLFGSIELIHTFAVPKNKTSSKTQAMLTSEAKKEIFKTYGGSETNTGSAESQIAMFSKRISDLTAHLKIQPKDFSTQRSLIKLVGQRRSHLNFLMKNDIERYRAIIKQLGIRK